MMAKEKVFGVLESESVLLEPVTETRYQVNGTIDSNLVGCWITVAGAVTDSSIRDAEVTNVEKSEGRVTRSGTIVATASNLPAEANGTGGYLYQEKKGRYFLLSSGAPDEPIQGDFGAYLGADVKVKGEFGSANYILYNVNVSKK